MPDQALAAPLSASDSIVALDRLATAMKQDLQRREQLEQEIFDALAALEQARAELVGIQAKERRARHLALHDSLTALPNRGCFHERLNRALAQAARQRRALAVLYLDLDGFKPINDTHGHAAGDELLRIIAARLTRSVRTEDLVSRLGGDEFACLVTGFPSIAQLTQLACKLFDAVAAPCKLRHLRLAVRPSIGIAIYPDDGTTADLLLARADAAMYRAKRHQIGTAFFDREVDV